MFIFVDSIFYQQLFKNKEHQTSSHQRMLTKKDHVVMMKRLLSLIFKQEKLNLEIQSSLLIL